MVLLESQATVEKNSSISVEAKEQLVSSKGHKISSTTVHGASSLKSAKSDQEEASFMGEGGEQQFRYHPNMYALQPQTLFSGGYSNHLGQWEKYPHDMSAEGLDAASPVMYGTYSPLSTIGDSQPYFSLFYPLSNAYYQPPASSSMGYSNSAIGISQFDPMYQYYLPDTLLYPPTPDFHQPFGSFDGAPMQSSGLPGSFGQGNVPLTSEMHQESMYGSGSYKALQQGGKFGGATPRWNAASCRFSTFSKGFKHEKGCLDFLNEQNHGPRATKTQKEAESSSAEDKNKKTLLIVDYEEYNRPDFVTEYKDAKFFVIKSYTEDHVHKSIKYNVWASTASGNRKLNVAYHEAKHGQFCGVAEMVGPVDFDKSVDYWQNDRWSGQFPVKWHIVKDVPNKLVRHIILENNKNKPVTNSRDTGGNLQVKLEQGLQVLAIFKNHEAETTILEDFDFYEQREKAMLDNRQQKKLQFADAEAQKLVETSATVDLMTHISATFARAVQLEETKGEGNRPEIEDTAAAEDTSAAP